MGGLVSRLLHRPNSITYRDAVLATRPVGYWRLNEKAGTIAYDECRAIPGTYVNSPTLGVAGLLTGDANAAVTFNGATGGAASYLQVDMPNLGTAYTILWWNKGGATTGRDYDRILQTVGDFVDIAHDYGTGKLKYYTNAGAGWSDLCAFAVGESAMLAYTYDGTNTKLCKNGSPVYSAVAGTSIAATTWYFGANAGGTEGVSDTTADLATWNRVLSDAEQAGLRAAGAGV